MPPKGRQHPDAQRHVVISGWYGHGNVGDEALLRVFCRELRKRAPVRITVLSENPKGVLAMHPDLSLKTVHHWPLIGIEGAQQLIRGRHRGLFQVMRSADLFVLGGGSLLSDNTTWKNFFRVIDELWLARLHDLPTALYAVGVGPFRSRLGKRLVGRAVRHAGVITVRDAESRQHLIDTGIAPDRVRVVTDPAFLLPAEPASDADLGSDIQDLMARGEPMAFVYPTDLPELSPGGLDRETAIGEIARGLDRLAADQGLSIVFVPFQHNRAHNDLRVAHDIINRMEQADRCFVLRKTLPAEEAKFLATLPKVNICVRLHAFIFAASQGCPAVALNYEPKVRNNARHFRIEDAVAEIAPGLGDDLYTRAVAALQGRNVIDDARLVELADGARETFDRIAELLGAPRSRSHAA
ncbi:MAG TPA: polysaccharide pyruvyl transferase family protein [Sphingomonadales bacterium]